MGDSEEDSKNKSSEDFDIKVELSTLVEKKQIPLNIANRLEKKLNEKSIKITKEQLYVIVKKINNIMQTFSKNQLSIPQKQTSQTSQSPQNEDACAHDFYWWCQEYVWYYSQRSPH